MANMGERYGKLKKERAKRSYPVELYSFRSRCATCFSFDHFNSIMGWVRLVTNLLERRAVNRRLMTNNKGIACT